jgi:hypothetical protein
MKILFERRPVIGPFLFPRRSNRLISQKLQPLGKIQPIIVCIFIFETSVSLEKKPALNERSLLPDEIHYI